MPVKLRFIEQEDFAEVMTIERETNLVKGTEGTDALLNPWAMSAEDILSVMRQTKDEEKGTYDTRVYVCVVPLVDEQEEPAEWIVGYFGYELTPGGYEVTFFNADPKGPVDEVIAAMAYHLKSRADRSENRKLATVYLRDRDEAGLRRYLPIWKMNGFVPKLVTNWFEGNTDAWKMTYQGELHQTQDIEEAA